MYFYVSHILASKIIMTDITVLGRKGTKDIILLLQDDKKYYTTIQDKCKINSRTLSRRLTELAELGLISRNVKKDRRVQYALTRKGKTVAKLVETLSEI